MDPGCSRYAYPDTNSYTYGNSAFYAYAHRNIDSNFHPYAYCYADPET